MPTYMYRCSECGGSFVRTQPDLKESYCEKTQQVVPVRRDWKAEGVGFTTVPGAHKDTYRGR